MNAASSGQSLACYGCVDFVNNERTMAYYHWACAQGMFETTAPELRLCSCPADSPLTPFTNPIDDAVCWYDSAAPESAEFLGLFILNDPVKGSTFSREVSDAFLKGSLLHRPMLKGRSFPFEVVLVATSCEGMNYGEEWLRGLLEDAPCFSSNTSCENCFGKRLGMRVACPEGDTADDGIHEWFDTGLVDGIQPVEDAGASQRSCCYLKQFTFTMQSQSPYSYSSNGERICEQEVSEDAYTRCYNWLTDCFDCCTRDDACDRCKYDPVCTCIPFTIPEPQLPGDPCATCEPLARIIQCCCTEDLPAIYDTTFKIDIYSGVDLSNEEFLRAGMRDFRLRIYQNPNNLDCIEDDDTYAAWCNYEPCVEIATSYIPYDSTLSIDGRTERVTLTCDGVCRPYDHVVTNTLGSLWPLASRCTPLMVCAEFSYYSTQLLPAAPGVRPASVTVDSFLRFRN